MNSELLFREANEKFEASTIVEQEIRRNFRKGVDFARNSNQWPAKIRADRESRHRSCITANKMPAFLKQVVNDARQNKPRIKTSPVDSFSDPRTARIIDSIFRNIETNSRADIAYDTAIDNSATGGIGYIRPNIKYSHDDTFDMDIVIDRIVDVPSVYGDAYSTSADGSDWNYAFVTERMSIEQFRRRFKGKRETSWGQGDTYSASALHIKDQMVIAEYWDRQEVESTLLELSDGTPIKEALYLQHKAEVFDPYGFTVARSRPVKSWKVKQYILSGDEILDEVDWKGIYIPIVPVYGEEYWFDGVRCLKGLIHDAIDTQVMYNYWRSQMTDIASSCLKTPYMGPKGNFESQHEKWANVNNTAYTTIEWDIEPPTRESIDPAPAGLLQEMVNTNNDMRDIIGMHEASLGMKSNETSGRAIDLRQREGDTGSFHFVDNLSRAIRHLGMIILDLIPYVYTKGRVLRIQDQVTKKIESVTVGAPAIGPDGQPMMNPDGTEFIYNLNVGKYDIIVESGTAVSTARREAATALQEFIHNTPGAGALLGDFLAKTLDVEHAEEIAERFRIMLPPQLQSKGKDPALEMQFQEAQQALQMAQQEIQSLTDKKFLEERKLDISKFGEDTKRVDILSKIIPPQYLQGFIERTLQTAIQTPELLPLSAQPPIPLGAGMPEEMPLDVGGMTMPEEMPQPSEQPQGMM